MKMQKQIKSNATDPNRIMQDMMDTIDSLRVIYVLETDALNDTDTKTFLELQGQKLEMARKYQAGIEKILARKEEMKNISPLLKNRLTETQKEFSDLATKNMEAIKRMQRCTERLGDTIMNAAKEAAKSQQTFAYGENGSIRGGDKKSVSMGVSETA
jgi:uncharacterized protein YukE